MTIIIKIIIVYSYFIVKEIWIIYITGTQSFLLYLPITSRLTISFNDTSGSGLYRSNKLN